MGPAAVVVMFALSTVAAVAAHRQQKKAAEVQKKQGTAEKIRARRRLLRERRIKQGEITNIAAQTGTEGSSGAEGASASLSSQTGTNLSFLDQSSDRMDQISMFQQRAADFNTASSIFASAASMSAGSTPNPSASRSNINKA